MSLEPNTSDERTGGEYPFVLPDRRAQAAVFFLSAQVPSNSMARLLLFAASTRCTYRRPPLSLVFIHPFLHSLVFRGGFLKLAYGTPVEFAFKFSKKGFICQNFCDSPGMLTFEFASLLAFAKVSGEPSYPRIAS